MTPCLNGFITRGARPRIRTVPIQALINLSEFVAVAAFLAAAGFGWVSGDPRGTAKSRLPRNSLFISIPMTIALLSTAVGTGACLVGGMQAGQGICLLHDFDATDDFVAIQVILAGAFIFSTLMAVLLVVRFFRPAEGRRKR